MAEEESGVKGVLERWRQKRRKKRMPTRFQELKAIKVLPLYKLKYSKKLRGKLLRVKGNCPNGAFYTPAEGFVSLHFFKKDIGRLGTYAQKTIPENENVIATGRVADFIDHNERKEQNAIEVFTTRGTGFISCRELELLKPSVDG